MNTLGLGAHHHGHLQRDEREHCINEGVRELHGDEDNAVKLLKGDTMLTCRHYRVSQIRGWFNATHNTRSRNDLSPSLPFGRNVNVVKTALIHQGLDALLAVKLLGVLEPPLDGHSLPIGQ